MKDYSCQLCNYTTKVKQYFKVHCETNKHIVNLEESLKCECVYCGKIFDQKRYLNRHVKICTKKIIEVKETNKSEEIMLICMKNIEIEHLKQQIETYKHEKDDLRQQIEFYKNEKEHYKLEKKLADEYNILEKEKLKEKYILEKNIIKKNHKHHIKKIKNSHITEPQIIPIIGGQQNETDVEILNNLNVIVGVDNQIHDYIYLLREREFIKSNEHIYKIGRTNQCFIARFKQYPKNSKLELVIAVTDSISAENILKKKFDITFIKRVDIGSEYYEGSKKEMKNIISTFCSQYY